LGISSIPLECVLILCALVKINWGYSIWNQADFIIIAIKTKKKLLTSFIKISFGSYENSFCVLSLCMAACGLVAQPAFLFTEKSSGGQSDSDVKKSVGEADVLRQEKENIRAM
jgi:hypothetical protein